MGVLMPSIYIGGGELSTLFIVEHADRMRIKWKMVVVTGSLMTEQLLQRFSLTTHIYFLGWCYFQGKRKRMSLDKAMSILRSCDGVITWELDEERSNLFNSCPNRKYNWIIRHDINHRNWVRDNHYLVTCSSSCVEDFGFIGLRNITIIPSAYDDERCISCVSREAIRTNWGYSNNFVVGYLGRMDKNKNVQAVARVVSIDDSMIAMCYGSSNWQTPDVLADVKRIAGSRLKWHPPLFNVGDVLPGFDVLMLPSYSEVFSLTLLEAWANKIPTVCTNTGEVPLLTERFGKICHTINPDADGYIIRSSILAAVKDNDTIERAYKMVVGYFNKDIIAKRWTEFLCGESVQ